jgi:hypothetical protein
VIEAPRFPREQDITRAAGKILQPGEVILDVAAVPGTIEGDDFQSVMELLLDGSDGWFVDQVVKTIDS